MFTLMLFQEKKEIRNLLILFLACFFSTQLFAAKITYTAPIVCEHCVSGIVKAIEKKKIKLKSHSADIEKQLIILEFEGDYELSPEDIKYIEFEGGYLLKKVPKS